LLLDGDAGKSEDGRQKGFEVIGGGSMRCLVRMFLAVCVIGPCGWFVCQLGGLQAEPTVTPVELKVVKYDKLIEAVKANRGKVIVVDVWTEG
jgi:hypothetical protein